MKAPEYARKGKTIINLTTGVVEPYKSLNAARKASRHIQLAADNGLGRGTLRLQRYKQQTKWTAPVLSIDTILRMRSGR